MPALIKASSSLLAGNPALVSYDFSDSLELSANINATFVTIANANVDALFRPGSPPPQALSKNSGYLALLASKTVLRQPLLSSCSVTIVNGLKTIEATYSAEVASPGAVEGEEGQDTVDATSEISTQTEQRSLSGSYLVGEESISFKIDYLVRTVTYDQSIAATGSISDVSASFSADVALTSDQSGITLLKVFPAGAMAQVSVVPVESIRTYRNNLGQARISVTRSAQLVQN